MTFDLAVVVLLMLATFAAMVWERVSIDVVALCTMSVLIATRVLTPQEAFSVFSNEAVITVASMFVLSAALIRTGALDGLIHWFDRASGGSEGRLLLLLLPVTAVLSAFVNNTPIVAMMIPVVLAQANRHQLNQSALLLPLSYASILGGLCTLVGTSTTILVSTTAQRLGEPPLTMFEVTPLGLICLAVGFLFLFTFGRRLLPARETLSERLAATGRTYLSELIVTPDSKWIGLSLEQTPFSNSDTARILEVKRRGQTVAVPLSEIRLEAGDILRVTSPLHRLMELHSLSGVSLRAEDRYAGSLVAGPGSGNASTQRLRELTEELRLVETVVGPQSRLVGRSVRQLDFRKTYQVLVLALHRRGGDILEKDFSGLSLEPGDSLLLQGEEEAIQRLEADDDFLVLSPLRHRRPRYSKRPIVLALCSAVVVGATAGVLPVSALALMAAVLCVLFRCLAPKEAYRAIEWRIVMMIFGMLSLGLALEKTGGAHWVADVTVDLFREAGPWVLLSLVLLLCSALTEFLSNNAVAVLLTPIVIEIAEHLAVDARPFLMAVVLGASASFATPIGYQTNTLVYGAGGYRFSDFLRVGLPMNLLIWALGSLLIPWLWPLTPR